MNGDKLLSTNDRHIWSLFYHVLSKYQCAIMFKVHGRSVPQKIDECIQFFVPNDHERKAEVIEFLKEETTSFVIVNQDKGWNTTVEIHLFSGIHEYLERDEMQKLVDSVMTVLTLDIKPANGDASH